MTNEENKTVRIFIVDDHQSYIQGIKLLLKIHENFEVVGEALNGIEALTKLENIEADIILLDIDLPEMNGEEVLAHVKRKYPAIKILVLTAYSEITLFNNLIASGANGFRLKNESGDEIVNAIKNIMCGLNDFQCKILLNKQQKKLNSSYSLNLSDQELQVVRYIANGLSSESIAEKMSLSKFTIDTYRKNALFKTRAKNSHEMIAILARLGMLD